MKKIKSFGFDNAGEVFNGHKKKIFMISIIAFLVGTSFFPAINAQIFSKNLYKPSIKVNNQLGLPITNFKNIGDSDSSLSNVFCSIDASWPEGWEAFCGRRQFGIFHPLVIITSDGGPWGALTSGSNGDDNIHCAFGGHLILINFIGTIDMERGWTWGGGTLKGFAMFASGNCG